VSCEEVLCLALSETGGKKWEEPGENGTRSPKTLGENEVSESSKGAKPVPNRR